MHAAVAHPMSTCYELEREFVFLLELPPVDADTVEVRVTGDRVVVTGGEDPDPEYFGKTDKPTTAFRREIALAERADAARLRATEVDGVLELRAPKLPPPRSRTLVVDRPLRIAGDMAVE